MIFGTIKNLRIDTEKLPKLIVRGLEYIEKTDISKLTAGKYEIDGTTLFALVQDNQTAPRIERRPETHKKYIDIQYIHSGSEIIGFGLANPSNVILENLLEQKDAIFFKNVKDEMELVLTEGMYAVFFPDEVHRPGCSYGGAAPVRKVVVKVAFAGL